MTRALTGPLTQTPHMGRETGQLPCRQTINMGSRPTAHPRSSAATHQHHQTCPDSTLNAPISPRTPVPTHLLRPDCLPASDFTSSVSTSRCDPPSPLQSAVTATTRSFQIIASPGLALIDQAPHHQWSSVIQPRQHSAPRPHQPIPRHQASSAPSNKPPDPQASSSPSTEPHLNGCAA